MIMMYAYSNKSMSAKALCKEMGIMRIAHVNSVAKPSVVINWGKGKHYPQCLNTPDAVRYATDKRLAFFSLARAGVSIPEWTESRQIAETWLPDKIVCRHKVTSHGGKGIEIRDTGPLPDCKLYTKLVPKMREYRIHVCNGKIIHQQQKVRKKEHAHLPVPEVRSHANGFIFKIHDLDVPACVREQGLAAIRALGLDFGAVDVIWNQSQDRAYILEVNTAPGLEGSSVGIYAKALRELIKERFNV